MSDLLLALPGPPALSDFRAKALARSIRADRIESSYIHYVALQRPLSDDEKNVLPQLLTYEEVPRSVPSSEIHEQKNNDSCTKLYVSPRQGTISPWSSKATNIAHVCGFNQTVRRIERGIVYTIFTTSREKITEAPAALYDRMTQSASTSPPDLASMFEQLPPSPAQTVPLYGDEVDPRQRLRQANQNLGLSLDESEIAYLTDAYAPGGSLNRAPYDVELFMFAQVNSEHCRHKQFNAQWTIDGQQQVKSLFQMIRNTHNLHPEHVVSAYSDNAAVLEGPPGSYLAPDPTTHEWKQTKETVHYLAKVETHNHPTAVSPYPGAATGSGGEIRDEGAVGRGSRPKAGLCGFTVSDLLIPHHVQPWELDIGRPHHIASSLDIMLEAPIGSAAFNNEFGRPCTLGYFRTFSMEILVSPELKEIRGYHKPIMIAGGVGSVRPDLALKKPELVQAEAFAVVLGGPAMLIGLGGGAASSISSGDGSAELDFASVQRGNAEVQRRAQEVINACAAMGTNSPMQLIHDVGAGGLSNALPELVHDAGRGAVFELREVDNADTSMSPLQIWCCEAQERYVALVAADGMNTFQTIAERERCGYSVVGRSTAPAQEAKRLILMDRNSREHPRPVDLPMSVLFGKPPKMSRVVDRRQLVPPAFDSSLSTYLPNIKAPEIMDQAVQRVLALPTVASKSFLITIGDRTVGGLTARDQMVGPWQVPVADLSVTATSLTPGIKTGEAMSMGERPPLALISPAASARMAVAEALTNIAAADLQDGLARIRLSANWMSASSHPGEGAAIFDAVEAIGMQMCPALGISIPVGKDSMSMKMRWKDADAQAKEVTAPLSVVISAFAPVTDIRHTWTPVLRQYEDVGETVLLFVDLAAGRQALGASALAQVFGQVGNVCPDVHDVLALKDYFDAISQLHESDIVLAYHDRSDGGLFTTLVEMMFAGHCGLELMLDSVCSPSSPRAVLEALFNEELGAVFQVRKRDETQFMKAFATCGPPPGLIKRIGRIPSRDKQEMTVYVGEDLVYRASRTSLQQQWSSTSYQMQRLRDNPACADAEYQAILDADDPGLSYHLTFDPREQLIPTMSGLLNAMFLTSKPRVAILREQGVNGHSEMAFAFMTAGFTAVDVHMTDLISGRVSLSSFKGLAACGGFSYGDVLGAGQGWAKSVLLHATTRAQFRDFFARPDTFTLGVCNGCQFLTRLAPLIPGVAGVWPTFERNLSEQYEARVCMVELLDDRPEAPSVFLHGMAGSRLPIAVAHGEGRAVFSASPTTTTTTSSSPTTTATSSTSTTTKSSSEGGQGQVSVRYVETQPPYAPTERYPANPNGSPQGIAGVRSPDGRVLAMMPHPERTVLAGVASYIPPTIAMTEAWGDFGPWLRLFTSARRWVG